MESKGRLPPPHTRRPMPGPGLVRPEPFGPGMRRPPIPFLPVDMLPPPEIMEQKIAAQHVEMQRLATENQRLAATHGTLRQELAAAQHELQMLHAQIGAVKSEREQQMRNLREKIAKMEAELQSAEHVKLELKRAREEAQNLAAARQELISKVQQLNQDLQRAHTDVQQIPALMSEFENLRQEYHQCRITYDYEKKLYDDHLQQLQVMEKNYVTMTKEVEKLRAELSNSTNVDERAVQLGPHGVASGNSGGEAFVHAARRNAHEDNYGVPQGRGHLPSSAAATASAAGAANASTGAPTYAGPGAQMGPTPTRPGYDTDRVPGYDPYRTGQGYPQTGYNIQRVAGHDMQRGNYDTYRGPTFATQGTLAYDPARGQMYDSQSRVAPGQLTQIPLANSMAYTTATPPPQVARGGGNPGRK
ncbi:protein FLX-like 2 isoform X2 [Punica granatum]|nr:protein FLX-like 2 isoform X2 [Punica granatum]